MSLVEEWITEEKVKCSELGDMIKPHDINLALAVYERGHCDQEYISVGIDINIQYNPSSHHLRPAMRTLYSIGWHTSLFFDMTPSCGKGFYQKRINTAGS